MKHLIELHLHLDGSLRAETMWELAMEQGLELEEKSVEGVRFAPQLHTQKGLTQAQVVEAAIRGTKLGMEQYPGIRVTLNSDNMTCSRVNIHSELDILRTVFGFTEEEIETIMQYAYEARFLKDYINEQ